MIKTQLANFHESRSQIYLTLYGIEYDWLCTDILSKIGWLTPNHILIIVDGDKWCATWKKGLTPDINSNGTDQPMHLIGTSHYRPNLFIDIFSSFQWLCKRAKKAMISLHICTGWSRPSLPAYAIWPLFSNYTSNIIKCHISLKTR